ncbi:hypothetical protein Q4551_07865 [Oceanobacter sp. 5_MG-2023]|nr:hypothetical protein [Oceanobacter sp. 5_MG-2023]
MKALLTILRKLYRQAGAGRKMSALMQGVTKPEVASFISPVIDVMEKNGFVRVYNQVVHPVRKNVSRVDAILSAPSFCDDMLITEVMKI